MKGTLQDHTNLSSSHARAGTPTAQLPCSLCPSQSCLQPAHVPGSTVTQVRGQQSLELSHSVAGDSPRTRLGPAHAATAAPAAALLTSCCCCWRLPEAPGQSTDLAVARAGVSQSFSGESRPLSPDTLVAMLGGPSALQISEPSAWPQLPLPCWL